MITTESHKLTVLRRGAAGASYGSCMVCGPTGPMVSVDEAVALSGLRTSDVVREVESGNLHSLEMPTGHLIICSRSLRELPTKIPEPTLLRPTDEEVKHEDPE